MKNLTAYGSAGAAFLTKLFGRQDPVAERTTAGLQRLESWDRIPEESALAKSRRSRSAQNTRYVLYGYEGPHLGECFFLSHALTTVGATAECGIVITPSAQTDAAPFEFKIGDNGLELRSLTPTCFELNRRQEHQSRLVDFDEIKINGNRFLVLSLDGEQT